MKIRIDGELLEVDKVLNFGYLPMVVCGREEYYLAESSEAAGKKAREYWEDMAENDPKEFTYLVGEETLIQWGLGKYAGPGSTQVRSLQEWLDRALNYKWEEITP